MTNHPVRQLLTKLAWSQILALGLFGLNAAWAQGSSPQQKLIFCSEGDPEYFAPSLSATATSLDVNHAIYDTLVRFVHGETKLVPSLAEHWVISKDGKEYTLFLQQGVKWHSNAMFNPTRHFNADDVIFTLERQWKVNHPYYLVTSANHPYFSTMGLGALIKTVEKLDDYTVKITLNEPSAPFLSMLAHSFAGIQSQEYAEAMLKRGTPEVIDLHPIGTGPFAFVRYEKNQKIEFQTFQAHWRGRAKIDALEFSITPNAVARWQKLQDQTCHVMPYPSTEDLDTMRHKPGVNVLEQVGLNVGYLAYNTSKAPFNDVRVRKALNMAINKNAIVERAFKGTAVAAINPIPPTMWSFNKQVKDDVFDPIAAKRLLSEAGFSNGFSTDLWVMPIERAYNPNPQLIGKMIQSDLARIGVKAEIKTFEWNDYYKRMTHGEHQMGLLGWTGNLGDPDYFFYNLLSCEAARDGGSNVAKFCHQPLDILIRQARTIANPALRIPLYEKAQTIFKEQAPWLTLANSMQVVITRDNVKNLRLSPFGRHDFYAVELMQRP